jgi:hypothetical protein
MFARLQTLVGGKMTVRRVLLDPIVTELTQT